MIITVVSVEPGSVPAGKKYQMLEVAYKDEGGKVAGKKVLSFNYPLVFNTLKAASQGEKYDVTLKKEGDYWNWVEIKKAEGSSSENAKAEGSSSNTKQFAAQAKGNYETAEERATRQVMIIRQSSLSTAVATLGAGAKSALDPENVIAVAKKYEEYVLSKEPEDPVKALQEMDDDLPY